MKLNKGFTLIELLVVIAIIGLLSSIVLASLGTARNKANDAKVQGQVASFRSTAEIYYSTNGGYSDGTMAYVGFSGFGMTLPSTTADLFTSTTTIAGIASTTLPTGTKVFYTRNGGTGGIKASAYAVAASLSNNTDAWCVDSAGASKKEVGALSGGFGVSTSMFSGNACL